MQVILCENVERLGKTGDTVNVKSGYARNFLIPGKLAFEATSQNLRAVEEIKRKKQLAAQREKDKAQELAQKLEKISCTIPVQAGEEDKLFGAVTTEDIQAAFETEGISLDKKQILLDSPIKQLGVYQVLVKLHPEVKATVKVWVVKK